ncbi:serine/threonine-protein kinase [Streptomyces sp. NPDC001922]|uniref:serine/threonine-protein kinase n=1 Tax=Streptomyces sp. NPDC001922 TaxID=3364624 RepID=UPI0036930867
MSDPGTLLVGRYQLTECVGRGGMGTVWRAEDVLLGRDVAVKKLIVPEHFDDHEIRVLQERMRREARSAAQITHPNVVVVHDVVDDDGQPCIVMEYVPSVTLGGAVKERGRLPVGEAARIGSSVAAALRAAHDAGVLHRDVKPANVLLGYDGRTVLTDFGIAVSSGTPALTTTGEFVGSMDYVAPERLRSKPASPASDLWALGATLYHAVEGRPPFRRESAFATAHAIAFEELEPLREAGELSAVIEGLLAKDAGERPDARRVEELLSQMASGSAAPRTIAPRTTAGAQEPPASAAPAGTRPVPAAETVAHAAADAGTPVPDQPTPPAPTAPISAASDATAPSRGAPRRRGRRAALLSLAVVALAAAGAGGALLVNNSGDTKAPPVTVSSSSGSPHAAPSPVPDGFRLRELGNGASVPVPEDWKRTATSNGEIAHVDPSGLVGLRIEANRFAGTDPLKHWRDVEEEQTRRDNPNYQRVQMNATTFRGQQAGYWEFTFTGRVRKYRAVELAFNGSDGTRYVIFLSAPAEDWTKYRSVFDRTVDGFRFPK